MAEKVYTAKFNGRDYEFVEELSDFVLCKFCNQVCVDPLQFSCCGKVICTSCKDAYELCGIKCEDGFDHLPPFKDSMCAQDVRNLKVKCPNGCSEVLELRCIENHLDDCYHSGTCKFSRHGCDYTTTDESQMKQHMMERMSYHLEICDTKITEIKTELKSLETYNSTLKRRLRLKRRNEMIKYLNELSFPDATLLTSSYEQRYFQITIEKYNILCRDKCTWTHPNLIKSIDVAINFDNDPNKIQWEFRNTVCEHVTVTLVYEIYGSDDFLLDEGKEHFYLGVSGFKALFSKENAEMCHRKCQESDCLVLSLFFQTIV